MPNSPFRILLFPIVLLFFVIGLAPLAHAAALMSPLDADDCIESGYIWVQRETQCVEFSYDWMGEWAHVGSTYPDLKGPFPHRWNYIDTAHRIEIGREHSVLTIRSVGEDNVEVVVWGGNDDKGETIRPIGLVMGSHGPAVLALVTRGNAAKVRELDPLRQLGSFKDEDTLIVKTKDAGIHFFAARVRRREPPGVLAVAKHPPATRCSTRRSGCPTA